MNIIVSKFGGSSLADADRFRQVLSVVASHGKRQYIILSAPGKRRACDEKITDLLLRAHFLFKSGASASEPLDAIRTRFTQIIQHLNLCIDPSTFLNSLEDDICISADHAASRGEYLCAKLFSAFSGIPFIDSADLIHFDSNGNLQHDLTSQSIRRMAGQYPHAILPGFYGSLPDGSIKTFSRGGSDITGALVAAAIKANIYENWTDVDGLMSADPAICPDAVCHPAVSYRQMHMLANAGAQILHPYCVEPVCEADIPTVLKNTLAPDMPGTYISDHVRYSVPCVCALHGFSAVSLDTLNEESRRIADGLLSEHYYLDGLEMIALRNARENFFGIPVEIVSAFGLPPELRDECSHQINHIGEQHSEYCSKYLVPTEYSQEAQRILHSFTASRILSDCAAPCRPSP